MPTTVLASRFNSLKQRIQVILGGSLVSNPSYGWGQTVNSTTVVGNYDANTTNTSKIAVEEYTKIYTDIIRARVHQIGRGAVSIEPFLTGNFEVNASSADIIEETYISNLESLMTQIESNRFAIDATDQATLQNLADVYGNSLAVTRSEASEGQWNGTLSHIFTVSFTSAAHRRHFFNGGGQIQFTANLVWPFTQGKTNAWQNLFTNMGTIRFGGGGTSSSTGYGTGSAIGNTQLTSTYQLCYRGSPSTYSGSNYEVWALQPNDLEIQFRVYFNDSHVENIDENVFGDLTHTIKTLTPDGEVTINGTTYTTVVSTPPVGNNVSVFSSILPPTTPTYTITPSVTNVNEGSSVTYTIQTANVPTGITLYWSNAGTTSANDFSDLANSGSFVTNSSGIGTVTRTLRNDLTTEGSETIILQIRVTSETGTIVKTASTVTVNDTSTPPPPAAPVFTTLTLSPSTVNITETITLNYSVTGATSLSYTITNNADGSVIASSTSATLPSANVQFQVPWQLAGAITATMTATGSGGTTTNSVGATVRVPTASVALVSDNPSDNTVVEEGTYRFLGTVTTTNVPNGYSLYWSTQAGSGTVNGSDFTDNTTTGSVTISSNSATFTRRALADLFTEGTETFRIRLRRDSVTGTIINNSGYVSILDTSVGATPVPTITASWSSASVQALNGSARVGMSATNAESITYEIVGGGVSVNNNTTPFTTTSTTNYSPYLTFDRHGTVTVTVTATGPGGTTTQTYNLTVTPYYTVTRTGGEPSAATVIGEGSGNTMTFTLTCSEAPGTSINYELTAAAGYPDLTAADFNQALSGTVIVNTFGQASVTYSARADQKTEGPEIFYVTFTGPSGSAREIGGIADYSQDPVAVPTYSITNPSSNVINEGSSGTFTVNTTNVANGTVLYWTISNLTTTNADFGATQGTVTINNNTGSFSVSPVADATTEGQESFIVRLRTGSYTGTIVASGGSGTTVGDTSTTPPPAFRFTASPTSNSTQTVTYGNTATVSLTITCTSGSGTVTVQEIQRPTAWTSIVDGVSSASGTATKNYILSSGQSRTISLQVTTGGGLGQTSTVSYTVKFAALKAEGDGDFYTIDVPVTCNPGASPATITSLGWDQRTYLQGESGTLNVMFDKPTLYSFAMSGAGVSRSGSGTTGSGVAAGLPTNASVTGTNTALIGSVTPANSGSSVSATAYVVNPTGSISISPTSGTVGSTTYTVSWSTSNASAAEVRLYYNGADQGVVSTALSGSTTTQASSAGSYYCTLMALKTASNGYSRNRNYTSNTVTASAPTSYSASLSPSSVTPNQNFTLSFSGAPNTTYTAVEYGTLYPSGATWSANGRTSTITTNSSGNYTQTGVHTGEIDYYISFKLGSTVVATTNTVRVRNPSYISATDVILSPGSYNATTAATEAVQFLCYTSPQSAQGSWSITKTSGYLSTPTYNSGVWATYVNFQCYAGAPLYTVVNISCRFNNLSGTSAQRNFTVVYSSNLAPNSSERNIALIGTIDEQNRLIDVHGNDTGFRSDENGNLLDPTGAIVPEHVDIPDGDIFKSLKND